MTTNTIISLLGLIIFILGMAIWFLTMELSNVKYERAELDKEWVTISELNTKHEKILTDLQRIREILNGDMVKNVDELLDIYNNTRLKSLSTYKELFEESSTINFHNSCVHDTYKDSSFIIRECDDCGILVKYYVGGSANEFIQNKK